MHLKWELRQKQSLALLTYIYEKRRLAKRCKKIYNAVCILQ